MSLVPNVIIKATDPISFPAGKVVGLTCGGHWNVTNQNIPNNTTVIAVGDSTKGKPILTTTTPGQNDSVLQINGRSNLTFVGISFRGNQTGKCITIGHSHHVHFNDCEITGGSFGVTTEGADGNPNTDITFTRCYIHDNFLAKGGDSSGLFASHTDGLVLTDNVFDKNGFDAIDNDPGHDIRNHNVYLHATNAAPVVTGNLFARASATGCQARSGGRIENNLFWDNPVQLTYGLVNGGGPACKGGVSGGIRGNVFVGGGDIGREPRGIPMDIGNVLKADVTDNLVAHFPARPPKISFPVIGLNPCRPDNGLHWDVDCVGIMDLTISGNKMWDWGGKDIVSNPHLNAGVNGNMHMGNVPKNGNIFLPDSKAVDLRKTVGGDPVAQAKAGTTIASMVAACKTAAAVIH